MVTEYSTARAVATRKNNAERKKLPLFADQLPIHTPEQVLEKRADARQRHKAWRQEFDARAARTLADRKARIAALVSEAEYAEMVEHVARQGWGEENGWSILEMTVRRRMEPMTDNEALVLAWLCNQPGDVTTDELHRRCGDGLTRQEVLDALLSLQNRGLAGGGVLRLCAVAGHDGAPYEPTTAGREWNETGGV